MSDSNETGLNNIQASVVQIKTEFKHINKRLDTIDDGMKQIQVLILQQNDLQREVAGVSKGYLDIKEQLSGLGKRLSQSEDDTKRINNILAEIPNKFKVNIFDYIWKYASVAIGGYIALKITGLLP